MLEQVLRLGLLPGHLKRVLSSNWGCPSKHLPVYMKRSERIRWGRREGRIRNKAYMVNEDFFFLWLPPNASVNCLSS